MIKAACCGSDLYARAVNFLEGEDADARTVECVLFKTTKTHQVVFTSCMHMDTRAAMLEVV